MRRRRPNSRQASIVAELHAVFSCRLHSCCLLQRLLQTADCQPQSVLLCVQRAAELKVLSQLVDSSEHKQRIQR